MVLILMGVTGSGKTTIGKLLASELGWAFYDADDFHPGVSIEKMRKGIPLTDADRQPWLETLAALIRRSHDSETDIILACSALKGDYREFLRQGLPAVRFVHLKGEHDLIKVRLEARTEHYMNPNLLTSQYLTLEEPLDALEIDVRPDPKTIVSLIRRGLSL